MQKEGKTLETSERKIATGEQKENQLADCIKSKLCVMWFSVPRYTRLKKLCDNMLNQTNWKLLSKIIDQVKYGLKFHETHQDEFKES